MASIYNGLLYNDDVNMAVEDNFLAPGNVFEPISDESSYEPIEPPEPSVPEVIDIDPSDTLTRIVDGWTPDLTPTGGTPGESYIDTPPTEKPENPGQQTKTIYSQTQIIISDYSRSYLQNLANQGAQFYVVYTDDTTDPVTINEIVDPHPSIEETIQVETEAIAKAINQYFWHDTNGVHVTDETQEDWFDAVADDFSDWPETPYHNILMNSLGLLLRTQLINLASLSRSGIAFYDGEGNESSNILASFGLNGSLFRANGRDVMRVTPNGVIFVPLEGNEVSVTMITDNIANLTNTVTSNKDEIDSTINALDLTISNIQAQIDGVIDTYYEVTDPEYDVEIIESVNEDSIVTNVGDNIVAHIRTPWMEDWTTEEIKAGHEGDLYYNIETGHSWRWLNVDGVWQWYQIADSDVAEAIQTARAANTLAGSKKRVFVSTPIPPYDIGDLWVDGSQVKYAVTAKIAGSLYSASDWEQTATDDTLAQTALNKASANETAISDLSGEVTVVKRDYVTNATYEQNNLNWAANLTSLETNVKQYSDGLISTEVTNRNSAITASANSINQTVAATYQVKGDYATHTDIANEVAARNTAIETKAGQILTSVSETYVTGIEFGTYTNQTSNDITTIIGDQSSVKSVIYKHDAILNEITQEVGEANSTYYAANDPVIDGALITDSNGNNIESSSSTTIDYYGYLNNNPVYKWTSDAVRDKHIGDTFINTTNSHVWLYTENYTWEYVENTDATAARNQSNAAIDEARAASQAATAAGQSATGAYTLADSKKRVFTVQPTPPYSIGDLWVDGQTTRYSTYARSSGSFNAADWRVTSTDDTNLNNYKDTIATIIRETNRGVLVAKAASSIGSLQGTSYFDIVGINSWSGSTPTIGATYARFGANGLSVYDNNGANELTFIGIRNTLPYMRLGPSTSSNIQLGINSDGYGYIDFVNSNNATLMHLGYKPTNSTGGGSVVAPYYTFGGDSLNSINDVDAYSSSITYGLGSLVRYSNKLYVAIKNQFSNKAPTNTTYWVDIGINASSPLIGERSFSINYAEHNFGYMCISDNAITSKSAAQCAAIGTAGGFVDGMSCFDTGIYNVVTGQASAVFGMENAIVGYGLENMAIGTSNTIYGGTDNFIGGNGNRIGQQSTSSGGGGIEVVEASKESATSFVVGSGNIVTGGGQHFVVGQGNLIGGTGYRSVVFGYENRLDRSDSYNGDSFVCGYYNSFNTSDIFEIGNGSSSTRSNAFRVTGLGYAYATSFQSSSDVRVKTDLGTLDTNESVKFIKSLKPHKYEKFGTTEIGFFAQDIENDPNYGDILVHQDTNYGYKDFRSLNYNGLIAPIVSALQNALDRIEQLENSK